MKCFFIVLQLIAILLTTGTQVAGDPNPRIFRIGLSSNNMGNINSNDYKAAFKLWIVTLGDELDLPMTAEPIVVDVDENLKRMLLHEELDGLTLTVKDMVFLNLQPESVYVTMQETDFHIRYVVIVQHDSGFTNLNELKGHKIVSHNGYRMVMGLPWLEVMQAGQSKGRIRSRRGDLIMTDNASKSILQVFFRQAQAALVEAKAFELACELNPQVQKNLRVISISPPFVPNFFMLLSTYRGKYREEVEKAIVEANDTPEGRQILSIFQSSRMEKYPASILEPTRQFLIQYQKLVHEGVQP